jgi:hypothetical protein
MIYNISQRKNEQNECLYKRKMCDGDDNIDKIIRWQAW